MVSAVYRGDEAKPSVQTCTCVHRTCHRYGVTGDRYGVRQSHPRCDPCYTLATLNKKYHILVILYIFIYVRIRIFNANTMVLFSLKSSEHCRSCSMITINQPYPAGFGSAKNGNYIQHYPLPSTHSCLPPTYITRCIVTYIL